MYGGVKVKIEAKRDNIIYLIFIIIIIIAYLIYSIPYRVDKDLPCVLYRGGYELVKNTEMHIDLRAYRNLLMRNRVKGTLEIEGRVFNIETIHYDSLIKEFKSKFNNPFYMLYGVNWKQGKSYIEVILLVSKDLKFFYGHLPVFKDEYGEKIDFVAPANNMKKGVELINQYLKI